MTVKGDLESMDELQSVIHQALQSQLEILKETRKSHSHSDLILPPDLVTSVQEAGSLHLKSEIESIVQRSFSDEGQREDIKPMISSSLFNYEARKLIFQSMQGSKAEGRDLKLERTEAKDLFDRLDVVLNLETYNLLDSVTPLQIIEEVLERLTIEACSLHFTYIELRINNLTRGLQPGKGKGLILLRFCNELIRRLSRPTRQHTVFAGRVLSLLSSVFPLGERSGVNFRGDFNVDNKTTWEDALLNDEEDASQAEEEAGIEEEKRVEEGDEVEKEKEIDDDKKASEEAKKEKQKEHDEVMLRLIHNSSFYVLFWKIQAWFANPALLFAAEDEQKVVFPKDVEDPVQGGTQTAMKSFRMATQLVLDVFGAVERKEKELAGKAGGERRESEVELKHHSNGQIDLPDAGLFLDGSNLKKRKHSDQEDDSNKQEDSSFFPKYLTGRNLFEYELRDATFRKHVLAQYLILFQYLLSFAGGEKEKAKGWKNKVLAQSNSTFTLDDTDDHWIRKTSKRVFHLVKEISSGGALFSDTILQTLKREARWINWKADNCPAIDRSTLSDEKIAAFSRARKSLLLPMRNYPHTVGTAALSRLWEDGVRKPEPRMRTIEDEEGLEIQVQTDGLDELEFGPMIPSLESYANQILKMEQQQKSRREELGWDAPNVYAIAISMPREKRQNEKNRITREAKDENLKDWEQMRILHAWRASRLARTQHLDRFSKMKIEEGGGTTTGIRIDDITRLMKAVQEKGNKSLEINNQTVANSSTKAISSPAATAETTNKKETTDVEMKEGDVGTSVDSEMARMVKVEDNIPEEQGEDRQKIQQEVEKEEMGVEEEKKEEEEEKEVAILDKDTLMQS